MDIYQTINAVMKEIGAIGKDKYNDKLNFSYRSIDQVMNELHGIMAEKGLFVTPNVVDSYCGRITLKDNKHANYVKLKVEYTYYAVDGSSIKSTVIGEAIDTGDKANNKALSCAYKYTLLQTFCIPTEDMEDPDAEAYTAPVAPQPKPEQKKPEPTPQTPEQMGMHKAAELTFKGGPSTPEEVQEINTLLSSVYPDGKTPVFTIEEKRLYSGYRKDKYTAQELIAFIKNALANRIGGTK